MIFHLFQDKKKRKLIVRATLRKKSFIEKKSKKDIYFALAAFLF